MAAHTMASIKNLTANVSIAERAEMATSIWTRFRGLMLRPNIEPNFGMVIDPCTSIHMFFMRFPIDVLYVDRDDRVVRLQEDLKPWRLGPLHTKGARYVVELPAGTVRNTGTNVGDQIEIRVPGS